MYSQCNLQERARSQSSSVSATNIIVAGRSLGGAVAIALCAKLQDARGIGGEFEGGQSGNALPSALIVENTFTNISDMVSDCAPCVPNRRIYGTFNAANARVGFVYPSVSACTHHNTCSCVALLSIPKSLDVAFFLPLTNMDFHFQVDAKFPVLNVPYFKEFFLRLKWDSATTIARLALPILLLSSNKDEIVPAAQMVKLRDLAASSSGKAFYTFDATHNDIWAAAGPSYWAAKKGFIQQHTSS